jgi:hypothetical protein
MLLKNLRGVKKYIPNLTKRQFSVQDENEDEKIFVSQQQIDYEKERRFLRDGTISF